MFASANAAVVPGKVTDVVPGLGATAQAGHEVGFLLGGRHDLLMLRIVSPRAEREAAGERQERSQRNQTPTPPATLAGPRRVPGLAFDRGTVLSLEADHVIPIGEAEIIHWEGPRICHRPRRRRCACAAWRRDMGR